MSFKYQVDKVSDNHYVLPKTKDMKTDIHAFLSEKLYEMSEEAMWNQAVEAASNEGVIGFYLQPDCHLGYGIPVGGVVVTEDVIIQSGSGYDISCGVGMIKLPLKAEDVAPLEKRRQLINEIERRIATGIGSHQPDLMKKFSFKQTNELLRYGSKPLGIKEEFCERQYIPIDKDIDFSKIEKAYNKTTGQLGSVGSGNHYIEIQVDENTGDVFAQIHCGSRGYGWQVANHFFYAGAELRGLPKNRRESSWLRIDEPLGKEYWNYHNSAANYAIANRHIIVDGVNDAFEEVFGVRGNLFYEISHNLVQEETLILPDGTTKKGFVHRKGATRAFPAGHPDLVGTKWEKTGHPVLIPGSMFDGAAVLYPKDSQKSGYSVNHGSGRIKPRGQAKRELASSQEAINNEMRYVKRTLGGVEIEGILCNGRDVDLSECKHVYKNLDDVLGVLEAENIAKIDKRLYPVANLKGSD